MNNYKSVRNRLFTNSEVELKSESVELALVDDVKARAKALSRDVNLLLSSQNEYFQIQRGMRTLVGVLENGLKAQSKDVEKAISALKELGIDNKDFFIYKKQIEEIETEVKSIDKKIS